MVAWIAQVGHKCNHRGLYKGGCRRVRVRGDVIMELEAREKFEDGMLLALKVEEGTTCQGRKVTLRSWKSMKTDSPPKDFRTAALLTT